MTSLIKSWFAPKTEAAKALTVNSQIKAGLYYRPIQPRGGSGGGGGGGGGGGSSSSSSTDTAPHA